MKRPGKFKMGFVLMAALSPMRSAASDQRKETDPCAGVDFSRPVMSAGSVFSSFSSAVFRIETSIGGEVLANGTGYMIDARHGYVLTAFHVVQAAYADPSARVDATNPALPGKVLELKIIGKPDEFQDVALLHAHEDALPLLGQIPALDIAFHFPPLGVPYFTIGYPRLMYTPNMQTAEVQRWDKDEKGRLYLEVKQDVDPGSSGSPLIDHNGAVVATCIQEIKGNVAWYRPTMLIEGLLNTIPADSTVRLLDQDVRNSAKTKAFVRHLTQELIWKSGRISNLELYEWANYLKQRSFEPIRPYASCPIIPAYVGRRLSDTTVVQSMSDRAPPTIRARVWLDAAHQNLFLGRFVAAMDLAKQAAGLYRELSDASGLVQALTIQGRGKLYKADYDGALGIFDSIKPDSTLDKARTEAYRAEAYAGRGDGQKAAELVKTAMPDLVRSGDTEARALALLILGRVEERSGNHSAASKHFAECAKIHNTHYEAVAREELARINEPQPQSLWIRMREQMTKPSILISVLSSLISLAAIVVSIMALRLATSKRK